MLTNSNAMYRTVLISIFWAIFFAGAFPATDDVAVLYDDVPQKDTPRELQEAWLRFHGSGLCQEVDASFIFVNGGVQVWSRIESDKSYSKFQALFAPLRNLHRVELFTNRSREEREWEDEDDPPPSLWHNYELRSKLGDRAGLSSFPKEELVVYRREPDELLKQRLLIYAEQVLRRNRKMEHYALGLFALARMASDPGLPVEIRSKAMAICLAHAIDLEKNIGKLASDLEQALPGSAKEDNESARPAAPDAANKPFVEDAEQIYRNTQSVSRRVHSLIYPEFYTVGLEELRNPSLIESIRTLRRTVQEFKKTLARSGRKQAGKKAG